MLESIFHLSAFVILVNVFIRRFLSNAVDAFTRYTFRSVNVFVNEYKLFETDCCGIQTGGSVQGSWPSIGDTGLDSALVSELLFVSPVKVSRG